MIKTISPLLLSLFLSGCNTGWFDKDNAPNPSPLKPLTAEVKPQYRWSTKIGVGTNGEYLKMSPALGDTSLYAVNTNGMVTAVNKQNGRIAWKTNTGLAIVSSPGLGEGIIVVGSRAGDVMALEQSDGRIRWRTRVSGEVLAKPAIGNHTVIIKTVDGSINGLSTLNGQENWMYKQAEPSLILRGASAPILRGRDVVVGFENGNLGKFSVSDGRLFWLQPIATPEGAFNIDRMIDIDANPVLYGQHIYAATYQGSIASLDWTSGKILWSNKISSYTGMTADSHAIYISDAKSTIWSFRSDNGSVNWRQLDLAYRNISGPALMGRYIVVGDSKGYLHWLNTEDGHLAGRVSTKSGPIYASPIVENNVLYALTGKGTLLAYTLYV